MFDYNLSKKFSQLFGVAEIEKTIWTALPNCNKSVRFGDCKDEREVLLEVDPKASVWHREAMKAPVFKKHLLWSRAYNCSLHNTSLKISAYEEFLTKNHGPQIGDLYQAMSCLAMYGIINITCIMLRGYLTILMIFFNFRSVLKLKISYGNQKYFRYLKMQHNDTVS